MASSEFGQYVSKHALPDVSLTASRKNTPQRFNRTGDTFGRTYNTMFTTGISVARINSGSDSQRKLSKSIRSGSPPASAKSLPKFVQVNKGAASPRYKPLKIRKTAPPK